MPLNQKATIFFNLQQTSHFNNLNWIQIKKMKIVLRQNMIMTRVINTKNAAKMIRQRKSDRSTK